ncbi:hypothetical protein F4818DRAFT_395860 [Hypoxylon cercidicola]|nr:hypothetical protein F4818DRAFT_395860 [Hypoxylon cercidicola]
MRNSLLLVTILSTSMALTVHMSPEPVSGELRSRRVEDDSDKCLGGSDYNACIPYLNEQCPLPANSQCQEHNSELCACLCSCDKDQCDAAIAPFPDYC